MADDPQKQRVDKWLWHARFFKTRTLAATRCGAGAIRVNGEKISKAATTVSIGDVLTFAQGERVRIIRIEAIGTRRGPAPEAQTLYSDLSPAPDPHVPANPAFDGKGRPTKRDRRKADLSRKQHLE